MVLVHGPNLIVRDQRAKIIPSAVLKAADQ